MDAAGALFIVFGLMSQVLLVCFFAARRWSPGRANVLGRVTYSFAGLGLPLAFCLAWAGAAANLLVGPLLAAGWAVFGAAVDVWRPRPWRRPPVEWPVLVVYVGLYFFAQIWLWWPLWDIARAAWAVFLALFVVNTALNIRGHVEAAGQRDR